MMKRLLDIIISLMLLIIFSPVLIAISLLIKVNLGSPVLFSQIRPGLYGRPFRIIKFRTMRDSTNELGDPLDDNVRLSSFGRSLRASSLDELPELWNVIKGEMSLIGPRPLLMEYIPLYTETQMRRHDVKPGITGWAQVNGRNAIEWEEKFKLDIWYVDNQSIWLDIKILLLTIIRVFRREGISQDGLATMTKFMGASPAYPSSEKPRDQR